MSQKSSGVSPFVLTIDIGSSSVRALLFDSQARSWDECQARCALAFCAESDGQADADADELVSKVVGVIDQLLSKSAPFCPQIAGVAVSTFWHNVLGVDGALQAVTPVYSWADTRSSAAAEMLRQRLNETEIHARTGCVLHPSYLPAKLLWLRQTAPRLFEKVVRWMSIGEYLYLKLFGRTACSISMASGTGLFDQHLCQWDVPVLEALSLTLPQLSPLVDLDAPLVGLEKPYAQRWPSLASIPWFPALGDGACNNVGCGCSTSERIALMVGTSGAMRVLWKPEQVTIPAGLWLYHADRRRCLIGGALSNGGLVYEWMNDVLRLDSSAETLERQLSQMAADGHGLTVLPFLAGERSPGWKGSARAAITGLSLHHRPLDILRASLESVAYRFGRIAGLLERILPEAHEVIACGGALLRSPAWIQIMADVLGRPVIASQVTEASSRGAALMALEALRVLPSIEEIPAPTGKCYLPDPSAHQRYQEAIHRQDELYQLLIKPVADLPRSPS